MTLTHLLILALIQGITEFLPISSSGHLILLPGLTGMADQGQALDVAVHVGTLGAVVLYFWSDVKDALQGTGRMLTGKVDTPNARLALNLLVATIPVIILGLFLSVTGLSDALRSIKVIGWTMLGFGILLYVIDQRAPETRTFEDWTLRHAIVMGLWQAIALFPGTSRSGITITGARQLGYDRHDGARIAMLMSIPTILASGALLSIEVAADANAQVARDGAIGAALAFLAALGALAIMMPLTKKISFTPYVIYRVILGAILLWIAYT